MLIYSHEILDSWTTYFIIVYLIVFRREEEREEAGDVEDPESSAGTRKSDLVGWYLGEIQEDIESEEELVEKKVMVENICGTFQEIKSKAYESPHIYSAICTLAPL